MCGISGVYAHHISGEQKKLNADIILSQNARGPDYQADIFCQSRQGEVVLGHNRLSIIDLSEHSHQPMWDATGRYCIVYNGEIYNYIELRAQLIKEGLHFNTHSDTEVILNAFATWGIASLDYLQGPFAFALFDKETGELWLCRDRFGVRPLFYIEKNNALYFASTSNALSKYFSLKPNLDYVARGLQYLVYEDGTESTAYHDLYSVPAGCYLKAIVEKNERLKITIKQYYHLANNVESLIVTLPMQQDDALLDMVNEKLNNAVKIRLRSDVPLAISLSGGLDSSSVAALVSRMHDNTIGFSFAHPQKKESEGPIVNNCADFLNIQMRYVWPDANEMVNALDKTITAQDSAFSSLSIIAQYMLYEKVKAAGIKVLLGGQGGDEAFMGYKKFLLFLLRKTMREKNYLTTAKHMLQLMPMFFSEMGAIKKYWQHRHRYLQKKAKHPSALNLPAANPLSLGQSASTLWKRQLQDVTQFSLPTLLRYEDRNAMGNSVESRLPYLDHQVMELGLALPEALKLRSGYGKWVIRHIMAHKIPDQIRLARYKRGFDVSMPALMKAGLGKAIRDSLQSNTALLKHFLKPRVHFEAAFSDQALLLRQGAIAEAVTLLWLNKVNV